MFKPLANPIMIVGDNPSLPGGLSRSGRDIATLCCTLPQFRVAYLGRGIGNRRRFPFVLYDYPESGGWGQDYIAQAWNDFAGDEYGVILTTDDLSRRHWFSNPVGLPDDLERFLGSGRQFRKWGYVPVDSTGPRSNCLTHAASDALLHYDRALSASEWGRNVMITSGRKDADWLPHGIWPDKFKVFDWPQLTLGWDRGDIRVGCVMANQARKDYPAAFECFAHLKSHYGNRFKAWFHTDAMIQYWNVYALAMDYGVGDCIEVTLGLSDAEMAIRYSGCDCTILPSGGEGFGFPIAESLACGTACVVTDYAAGQEIVEESCRVAPIAYRIDTQHNVLRAVLSGTLFAKAAIDQIEKKRQDWEYRSEQLAATVEHLHWPNLKHLWTKWMLEGLR